jgi:hypothetical protein
MRGGIDLTGKCEMQETRPDPASRTPRIVSLT